MTFSNEKEQDDYLTFSFQQNFVLLDRLGWDNHNRYYRDKQIPFTYFD
jgi:hypothetical protein